MTIPIFLSCPTALSARQQAFYDAFVTVLQEAGFEEHSVGRTDFGNTVPLLTIRRVMSRCAGAVMLGFEQLRVDDGVSRNGTPRELRVSELRLPTPWNHLEAGIAFQADLPMLVIRDCTVAEEGIFGPGVSDRFIHHADLSPEWLTSPSFTQPFREWADEVRLRSTI